MLASVSPRAGASRRSSAWVVEPSALVHRLMAARVLAAAGDTTGAIHLHSYVDFDPPFAPWGLALVKPYALLERARLHEGQKRMREARLDYEAFLRHFDTPVASLAGLRRTGEEGYARIKALIR